MALYRGLGQLKPGMRLQHGLLSFDALVDCISFIDINDDLLSIYRRVIITLLS